MNTKILKKCTRVDNFFHSYFLYENKGVLIFKTPNISYPVGKDERLDVLENELHYNQQSSLVMTKPLTDEIKKTKFRCLNIYCNETFTHLYGYDYSTRRYILIGVYSDSHFKDTKSEAKLAKLDFAGFDPSYFKKLFTFFGKEKFLVFFDETKFVFKGKEWEVYLFGTDSRKFKEFILNK